MLQLTIEREATRFVQDSMKHLFAGEELAQHILECFMHLLRGCGLALVVGLWALGWAPDGVGPADLSAPTGMHCSSIIENINFHIRYHISCH